MVDKTLQQKEKDVTRKIQDADKKAVKTPQGIDLHKVKELANKLNDIELKSHASSV